MAAAVILLAGCASTPKGADYAHAFDGGSIGVREQIRFVRKKDDIGPKRQGCFECD